MKFDGWPRKLIWHFFYTTSSFLHHFKSIGEFKLELQSGNVQFESKLAIFCLVWPWNLMDDLGKQYGTSSILHQALCTISNPSVKSNLSYSLETLNSGQNLWFFVLCDLEIWLMTLKNNRDLFYITLSFGHHFKAICEFKLELQSGNAQFWSKSTIFLSRVTLKFDLWPWKTIGHLSYAASRFVHHFIAIG